MHDICSKSINNIPLALSKLIENFIIVFNVFYGSPKVDKKLQLQQVHHKAEVLHRPPEELKRGVRELRVLFRAGSRSISESHDRKKQEIQVTAGIAADYPRGRVL
jgi:hypothetical protein